MFFFVYVCLCMCQCNSYILSIILVPREEATEKPLNNFAEYELCNLCADGKNHSHVKCKVSLMDIPKNEISFDTFTQRSRPPQFAVQLQIDENSSRFTVLFRSIGSNSHTGTKLYLLTAKTRLFCGRQAKNSLK